ncbi:acyl-CoA synthetase [Halobacillus massiliensis]|uniref:acyl-CoA synthetase n=1 Tax=Halobacillus massiliensis TaxID=1926286 RepID=UPI0009E6013F|nr:long-chain fatty acid--CoA ligase [Halobacillus massiliensis]
MIEFKRSKQLLVDQMLIRSARRSPDKAALVSGEVRITYQELNDRVNQLAGWFQRHGIQKGDKAAILLYSGVEYVECLFALAKIGAVTVPINFRLKEKEIQYLLNDSDAKMLILDGRFLSNIEYIQHDLHSLQDIALVGESNYNDTHLSTLSYPNSAESYQVNLPELQDEDDCLIGYTSGTTGHPKGAVLTHKNVFMNAMNYNLEFGLTKHDIQLMTTPIFHIGGISTLTMLLFIGGTSIISNHFDPQNVLQTFEEEKVSYAFMVPSMWNMLLEQKNFQTYDVSSLRILCTAAASTPLELKKRLMTYFPNAGVYDTYGQTETSPGTTTLKPDDPLTQSGSVGLSFTNVEVRVVDENMNDVSPGEVGEIVFRGPTTMKEYYKNTVATEEVFKEGWLHSGDLALVDKEGYLSVVDRKKDLVISGGENIYPKEIEEVLYTHRDILEAAVIGVPDEKWGETLKAFVVTRDEKTMTEEEVIDFCYERLAGYKKPKYVQFVKELPRNAAGKILKTELRKIEVQS